MEKISGRWDMTIGLGDDAYPSWVELEESTGRFVGRFGSARPLGRIARGDGWVSFSLPRQYESRKSELCFFAESQGDQLVGTTMRDNGCESVWYGERAPELPWRETSFGEPIDLLAIGLAGWRARTPSWDSQWSNHEGVLTNAGVGTDLVTVDAWNDFYLVAEYSYPLGSNSGIYLRGRYEFQIVDDSDSGKSGVGNSGAIYGFIAPSRNAAKDAGGWNRAEITLIGRYITVVLNGEVIMERQEIPGITGGALDSNEGAPGPIFVQGDHGPVSFRTLTLAPAV